MTVFLGDYPHFCRGCLKKRLTWQGVEGRRESQEATSRFTPGTDPPCRHSPSALESRIGRVGPGAFAPRPLTEPDLWVTHPALWVCVSQVKQQRLTRGR